MQGSVHARDKVAHFREIFSDWLEDISESKRVLRGQHQLTAQHAPKVVLLQGSTYVGVAGALRVVDDEDDVILGSPFGDDGLIAGLVGDGHLVDSDDDGALVRGDLVSEGAGPDAGGHDAAG